MVPFLPIKPLILQHVGYRSYHHFFSDAATKVEDGLGAAVFNLFNLLDLPLQQLESGRYSKQQAVLFNIFPQLLSVMSKALRLPQQLKISVFEATLRDS